MTKKQSISIIGPKNLSDLRLTAPQQYAAGISAVKVALDHAMKEMGLTRSFATLSKLNQQEGIDCPGCAWPDPKKRSSLGEFCENGVKAIAEEATTHRVTPDFFAQHTVAEMSHWTDYKIGKSGRLTHPMVLREGSEHYEKISWDDAFALIGKQLRALDDPNEGIFYTSGRSSNEAAFLYGLFIRAFGTNNMPDCSNMCHESSGVALGETLGIGKGSVTLEDFGDAEVVMVIGQNPGTNHPRMLSALEKCKSNGGKVIAINPLEEAGLIRFKNPQEIKGIMGGTELTDIHLQVKINQDVALLKLIMKRLAEREERESGVFDWEFINQKTNGVEALLADLKRQDEAQLLAQCGISEEKINETVELLAQRKRIIICWAMGLTQHKNGVENIKECVNLLLLKGSLGIKGGGTCPVRGHSNVQGDRTVGIMHHVSPKLNASLERVFGFTPPDQEGLDTVHAIQAMHEGRAKVFIALGGNFLSAASDTAYTGEALQRCDLTVSISTKLNRTHLITGKTALILPTLGRTEKDHKAGKDRFVTVENSMGRVHQSHGRLAPASDQLMSEPEIVARMAQAYFGVDAKISWQQLGTDYDLVRQKISEVFDGFDNYTKRSQQAGFDLPNHTRVWDESKLPGGKAQFTVCGLPQHDLAADEFLLMTIRSHDQFNTTIYGMDDRYRGIYNERRVVLINAKDAEMMGLEKFDKVDLVSRYDGIERKAENFLIIPYNIPRGNLAAYFPETNVLIPHDQYADKSHTPISKSVRVKLIRR
ncbi:oxidoreductase alpha (molybdopterin) subunit [Reichenbachiella agariperforans]|uniref:Oxidoreductase alpha (Molybdopterin) subunit n=1 Tax=Reichenbachiella agariperforans TaxID=156994 RepID=A0A1M6ULQ7_REIAG|nr:FdhF/YdeP family oxidoreductase [Reichenbachiella agariperforans]SHK70116.1 oxidoreductase alpha (molybdopterin) subunit [Reichenbachiella agariperforans]